MITLENGKLVFSFPDVHKDARLTIDFQRTLRIPDDNQDYPLPPGLGLFPLRHVDDFDGRAPKLWMQYGGVMLPMYQSEALWLNFDGEYPFAIKIATGKINAIDGKPWTNDLHRAPQDYVVTPSQPWLDGYCVEKGIIRQFVAMPLGAGFTAEEQLTGKAEHGGLQIIAYPIKPEKYKRPDRRGLKFMVCECAEPSMGLAPGGRMRQEIYDDPYQLADWDQQHFSRCFVHICNSMVWREITGEAAPTVPFTAKEYTAAGLPWFEYYDDSAKALKGSKVLKGLKSVAQKAGKKGGVLPGNEPVKPGNVISIQPRKTGQVREWQP